MLIERLTTFSKKKKNIFTSGFLFVENGVGFEPDYEPAESSLRGSSMLSVVKGTPKERRKEKDEKYRRRQDLSLSLGNLPSNPTIYEVVITIPVIQRK